MLTAASKTSDFLFGSGLLISIIFTTRFLNVIFPKTIFVEEKISASRFAYRKLICNKVILISLYSIIGEIVFLIIMYLMEGYDCLNRIMTESVGLRNSSYIGSSFIEGIVYRIVTWIIVGLSFLVLMIICNSTSLENPCKTAWNMFWILNLFIVPMIVLPCLRAVLFLIIGGALANKIPPILLGVGYLFVIFHYIKKKEKRNEETIMYFCNDDFRLK